MEEVWARIETHLGQHRPEALTLLNKGASESVLDTFEIALSVALPEDIHASYKCHNGASAELAFLYGEEFLSLEEIKRQWDVWKDLLDSGDFADASSDSQPCIRTDWWHPAWLPLTYDGSGNHVCLDLAPTAQGRVGQLIRMWHDDAERTLEANSFREWLAEFADGLESENIIYSEDYEGFVNVDDL